MNINTYEHARLDFQIEHVSTFTLDSHGRVFDTWYDVNIIISKMGLELKGFAGNDGRIFYCLILLLTEIFK